MRSNFTDKMILTLAVVSGLVFIGQVLKVNVWALICAYWCILTIKNIGDYRGW